MVSFVANASTNIDCILVLLLLLFFFLYFLLRKYTLQIITYHYFDVFERKYATFLCTMSMYVYIVYLNNYILLCWCTLGHGMDLLSIPIQMYDNSSIDIDILYTRIPHK